VRLRTDDQERTRRGKTSIIVEAHAACCGLGVQNSITLSDTQTLANIPRSHSLSLISHRPFTGKVDSKEKTKDLVVSDSLALGLKAAAASHYTSPLASEVVGRKTPLAQRNNSQRDWQTRDGRASLCFTTPDFLMRRWCVTRACERVE
jgi:hypothetical protein